MIPLAVRRVSGMYKDRPNDLGLWLTMGLIVLPGMKAPAQSVLDFIDIVDYFFVTIPANFTHLVRTAMGEQ